MKSIKQYLSLLLLTIFLVPTLALAQGGGLNGPDSDSAALTRLKNVLSDKNNSTFDVDSTDENTLTEYIGLLVNIVLGLLGVIFTILIIYSGYTWMTAGGNEDKVSKAGTTIKVAIIGLLIVIGAFAIWRFVFERIML
ncbi:MAG: hypothetical protein V1765_03575 [bacterium]